ncbi:hypothetical protein FHT40_006303 [Mycolicibacterium sp. BK556]|uniref:DUF732 domain-containing protein n=1 Tax=unclassified Mycolicibacterium TaxID=2636767 RepID=UPI001609395C|nr:MULTISPECIES: DUF732 domain-containing protein [unclassified Mycolicibacterium]MBB3606612.1 hypothetical protein [Mycolicibacterium sp. BK556]MBB3636141.1 hypothetical protein [Mycolicibacterium sp. BK607]
MGRTEIAVCALALAPALMLTSPVAKADEVQYLNQVASKVSVVVEPSQALSLGNTVCQTVRSAMANGMSLGKARAQADQAVGWAQQKMGLGLSEADGMFLTDAAVDQLC